METALLANRRNSKIKYSKLGVSIEKKMEKASESADKYVMIGGGIIVLIILQISFGFLTAAYLKSKEMVLGDPTVKDTPKYGDTVVPPIVHFVHTNQIKYPFSFRHALSIISAAEQIQPETINLWFIRKPQNVWWHLVEKRVPKNMLRVRLINTDKKRRFPMTDHGDVIRLEKLLDFGGILLDFNVIVLRPLETLMQHKTIVGSLAPDKLSDHMILAERGATFIKKWRRAYERLVKPADVAKYRQRFLQGTHEKWPKLLRTYPEEILRPFESEIHLLKEKWDWRNYYAANLWPEEQGGIDKNLTPEDIDCMDTSLGEILRHVYYGSDDLRCHQEL